MLTARDIQIIERPDVFNIVLLPHPSLILSPSPSPTYEPCKMPIISILMVKTTTTTGLTTSVARRDEEEEEMLKRSLRTNLYQHFYDSFIKRVLAGKILQQNKKQK